MLYNHSPAEAPVMPFDLESISYLLPLISFLVIFLIFSKLNKFLETKPVSVFGLLNTDSPGFFEWKNAFR